MKQKLLIVILLLAVLAGLFYAGGTIMAIGLSVIALTSVIFLAFALGAKWAQALIMAGLDASARNTAALSQNEVVKTKAVIDLVREIIKTGQGVSLPPSSTGYPPLPLLPPSTEVDTFTIAGLDDNED